jgi:hypothetical protein
LRDRNYSGLNQADKVAGRLSGVDFRGFMIALRKLVANFSNSSKDSSKNDLAKVDFCLNNENRV